MLTALDETILSTIARRPLISHKGNFWSSLLYWRESKVWRRDYFSYRGLCIFRHWAYYYNL